MMTWYIIIFIFCAAPRLLGNNFIRKIAPETNEAMVEVDLQRKAKDIEHLVFRGAELLKSVELEEAINKFKYKSEWRNGEVSLFIITQEGRCIFDGNDPFLTWKKISKPKSSYDQSLIDISKTIATKGNWVSYRWNNSYKSSFLKRIIKNNRTYFIGAGFFPESQEYITEQLVKTAGEMLNELGLERVIDLINNPRGPFVKGDISLYIGDVDGNILADAENDAYIGQNMIDMSDDNGFPVIKKSIELARSPKGEGWLDLTWRGELQRAFTIGQKDNKTGKIYFIGGVYYPNIDERSAVLFTKRALKHLQNAGATKAFADFSNTLGDFKRGSLSITAYDYSGKNLANGEYPAFVGLNMMNYRDTEGRYMVREIISNAKLYKSGLVSYIDKNAYKTIYFERIDAPDGKFILSAGYFPSSKINVVTSLVDKGIKALQQADWPSVLNKFSDIEGEFFQGDVYLFVYSPSGTVLANGVHLDQIWQDKSGVIDDRKRKIVEELIAIAQAGGGWFTYDHYNAKRRIFVRAVTYKDEQTKQEMRFIVGSGYYL